MLLEPGEVVVLLPGQTRYEQAGASTLTSTERRIRFPLQRAGWGGTGRRALTKLDCSVTGVSRVLPKICTLLGLDPIRKSY